MSFCFTQIGKKVKKEKSIGKKVPGTILEPGTLFSTFFFFRE